MSEALNQFDEAMDELDVLDAVVPLLLSRGGIPVNSNGASGGAELERRYRLYSAADLDLLPPAEWFIEDAIPQNAIVGLIGAKGSFKTFVALLICFYLALGRTWQGRKTRKTRVVYVYAEGPFGAKSRIEALCQFYSYLDGTPITRSMLPIFFLPRRVPFNDSRAIDELLEEIQTLTEPPEFVVVDTVNANLDGDEDGKGMNGFVAGCIRLRDALTATVMVVHHTPLGIEDRGRGHSSLDGALDTRFIVSRDDDRVVLECTHQRNASDGWSVAFEAVPIAGSLALKPSSLAGGELKGQRRSCLEVLHQQGTATYGVWLKATELKASSFKKARSWLAANSYVRAEGTKYVVTDAGSQALGTLGLPEGYRAK